MLTEMSLPVIDQQRFHESFTTHCVLESLKQICTRNTVYQRRILTRPLQTHPCEQSFTAPTPTT